MTEITSIKMFVPDEFLDLKKRGFLLPILRPYFKNDDFTDSQRIADYGISESDFSLTTDRSDADVIVIPMAWEHYISSGTESKLMRFIFSLPDKALVWSWNSGDHGVDIPDLPNNVVVFRLNSYRSKLKGNERSMPAFFQDPTKELLQWNRQNISGNTQGIKVGFCGQAKGNTVKYIVDMARTLYRNVLYTLKFSPYQPHYIIPSSWLRNKTLKALEHQPGIRTDFIKRRKYRAGAKNQEERNKSRIEFLNNINDNDFTVSLRGGGNFSVRLYETMAMGRIPLQVDTDCVYPLPEYIDWKKQTCYVERDQINKAGQLLKVFVANNDIKEIQLKNRDIWADLLTLKGFFSSEYKIYMAQNV